MRWFVDRIYIQSLIVIVLSIKSFDLIFTKVILLPSTDSSIYGSMMPNLLMVCKVQQRDGEGVN